MRITLAAVLLWMAACTSQGKQGSTTPAPNVPPGVQATSTYGGDSEGEPEDDDVQCHEEQATGTLMTRTFCRDKFERDGDRRDAMDMLTKSRANPQ